MYPKQGKTILSILISKRCKFKSNIINSLDITIYTVRLRLRILQMFLSLSLSDSRFYFLIHQANNNTTDHQQTVPVGQVQVRTPCSYEVYHKQHYSINNGMILKGR